MASSHAHATFSWTNPSSPPGCLATWWRWWMGLPSSWPFATSSSTFLHSGAWGLGSRVCSKIGGAAKQSEEKEAQACLLRTLFSVRKRNYRRQGEMFEGRGANN
eukprot:1160786-Pelagomonas_calceolata.AAC.15